jgi:cytochrome c biogenesis protein CcmG/thiol:disulfide interchange protein DsbE
MSAPSPEPMERRSLMRLLPLVAFALLAGLFLVRLFAGDASRLPSALIGKPAPSFALPAVEGLADVAGFSGDDLRAGHVTIINVFASWCVPCHAEHSTLFMLAADPALKAKGVAFRRTRWGSPWRVLPARPTLLH